jgi:excisionase family DNA binding protein
MYASDRQRESSGIEPLWSVQQVARATGLSDSGVRRLARAGILPTIRFGHRILFRPSAVMQIVSEREVGGSVPPRHGRRPS